MLLRPIKSAGRKTLMICRRLSLVLRVRATRPASSRYTVLLSLPLLTSASPGRRRPDGLIACWSIGSPRIGKRYYREVGSVFGVDFETGGEFIRERTCGWRGCAIAMRSICGHHADTKAKGLAMVPGF